MALPPLQDLLDLFPDNTQGLITPDDMRTQTTELYNGIADNAQQLTEKLNIDGGVMTGSLILNQDPVLPLQACTKQYADNLAFGTGFVIRTGDTMTGDLNVPATPSTVSAATSKGYVDQAIIDGIAASGSILADGTVNMVQAYIPATPKAVATKEYVDAQLPATGEVIIKNPIAAQNITGGQDFTNDGVVAFGGNANEFYQLAVTNDTGLAGGLAGYFFGKNGIGIRATSSNDNSACLECLSTDPIQQSNKIFSCWANVTTDTSTGGGTEIFRVRGDGSVFASGPASGAWAGGIVQANGTATKISNGWSVSKQSAGTYIITHPSDSNWVVTGCSLGGAPVTAALVQTVSNTQTQVQMARLDNSALADSPFQFTAVKIDT